MSTKPTIAVIGLGIMGHGIAENFLKNGYKVILWNRSSEKAADLLAKGALSATSIKDAVKQAGIVFEVTANDESSQYAWEDKDGILDNATNSPYLITCATLSVDWTDRLAKQCADRGLTFFDMPMTGGRAAAESGQLTLLVGGDENKLNDLQAPLAAIAKDVKYFGKAGAGMRYKLILNTLQAIHMTGLGEAVKMAEAVGLDKNLVGQALVERPGGAVTTIAWEAYKKDPDPITFSVEWMAKDLTYATEMVKAIEHPLLDDARALYEHAVDEGYGQGDWSRVNKLSE